jgi:hypothetical protein
MRNVLVVGVLSVLSLVGCADQPDDNTRLQTVKGGDNGTHLSVTSSVGEPVCTGDGTADVSLSGTLTSTASAAWADVSVTIDGVTTSIDEVLPTDYSKDGRTKTYDYSYTLSLTDGTHEVQICFTQPSGHDRMTACGAVQTVVVACSESPDNSCGDGAFGETVTKGNHNICSGKAAPAIEINAKGDFGDNAQLTISGPNQFTKTVDFPHSGNSCVYHYNWQNQFDNGNTGIYTFTVTVGGVEQLSWSDELFCAVK